MMGRGAFTVAIAEFDTLVLAVAELMEPGPKFLMTAKPARTFQLVCSELHLNLRGESHRAERQAFKTLQDWKCECSECSGLVRGKAGSINFERAGVSWDNAETIRSD